MISPTIGRVVLFTPSTTPEHDFTRIDQITRYAAMVAYVWGDRLVNLVVFDHQGKSFGKTSVPLLQDDDPKPERGYFCTWMPYQIGQAAKYEELLKTEGAK